LEEIGISIIVEVNDLLDVIIRSLNEIVKHTLDDLSLTTTSLSYQNRRVLDGHEFPHQELEGNSVDSGDGVRGDGSAGINGDIGSRKLGPLNHLLLFNVNIVVVDGLLELDGTSSELTFPPVGEFFSVIFTILLSEATTDTPDDGEYEDLLESSSLDFLYLKDRLDEFTDGHNHGDLYLRDDMFEILSYMVESFRHVSSEFLLKIFLDLGITSDSHDPGFNVGSPLVTISIGDEENTSS
jgi:hypothetical protein